MYKDIERIIKKQKISNKQIVEQIDQVISELNKANQIGNYHIVKDRVQTLKPLTNMKAAHNDQYAYISKMGKNMDKLYQKNLQYGQEHIELDKNALIEIIKMHLLREGEFNAYKELVTESQTSPSQFQEFFWKTSCIAAEIKEKNLEPAIEWAKQNNIKGLLFQLYKQRFVQLAQQEGKDAAIQFARKDKNFQQFSQTNIYDIQQLMTSLLFLNDIQNSKYDYLYKESNWNQLLNLFLSEASKSQNLLSQSELKIIFQAGCLAMPKLVKYNSITKTRSSEVFGSDIPIEIEIGKEYKYHSFFVCPVTREVCLPSNPPMLLKCGHVVSQHSIEKMTQIRSRFKCPTCPVESKVSDLKQLKFV